MSGSVGDRTGTAKKITDYLKRHVGEVLDITTLKTKLNLNKKGGNIYQKFSLLERLKHVKRVPNSSPLSYEILPAILEGKDKGKPVTENEESYTPQLREIFFKNTDFSKQTDIQKAFRDDIDALSTIDIADTMARVVRVNEQNKMLRSALENIVLIIEQAGVIEKSN